MTKRPWRLSRIAAYIALPFCGCDKLDEKNVFVPPPPPEVIVANPQQRDVVDYLTYTGVIEANETVELRARVTGFLMKVLFQPGQRVKKGDELFLIDPREYQNAVAVAEAEVKAQEAMLVGAENDAKLAKELAEKNAGPAIDAVIKAAARDTVIAHLASAKTRVEQAKLNLEYCHVVSPIDGRIGENLVDEGNLVGGADATLLATIVNRTPVYVHIDASESDLLQVMRANDAKGPRDPNHEPGQIAPGVWRPCELRLADEKEYSAKGVVDHVEPAMNATTGTLGIRTMFENPNEALVPGMFATLRFPMSTEPSLLVPEAALLSDQQGRYALVVNAENAVETRRVELGVLEGELRVVKKGLSPADRVVVLGVLKARPGSKVTPKIQTAPTSAN